MIKELKSMFEKQAGVERFDLIQTFNACKQEEGKPVAGYVLKMKGYLEQLEHLGYVLPKDLSVGLILNGLTSDFGGFVRNYNMHNMGKTIGEIHALLIEYEKGLPKKAETPQVMMIKSGKIQKANKKSLKAKGKGKANSKGKDKQVYIPKPKNTKPSAKEHPAKDDTCHQCKEVYDTGCGTHICITKHGFSKARKMKQGALYLYVGNGVRAQVEAIRSFDLVLPNGFVICLDNCHYAPSITRGIVSVHRLVENGFVQCFMDFGILVSKNNVHYFNAIPSNGIYEIDMHDLVPNVNSIYNFTPPYTPQHNGVSERRNRTLLDMVRSMMNLTTLPLSFWDYALESATCILNMVPTKKVNKTPYELWYGKVLKLSYLKETMGYYFYFPPENKIVVARYVEFFEKNLITQEVSERAIDLEEIQDEDTSPFKITSEIPMEVEEAEEHSLRDFSEPTSYKSAMLDSESNKWIDAMNAEIQSMIDNIVWVLVDLPPNSRLIAKGYTQLYEVDYEETFSPVADIRAIRILISIAAFYDYEIWQIDVKTAFLNGYLNEDIYMLQPEGFVDPNHPIKGKHNLFLESNSTEIERLDLNKTQGASTPKEVKHMQNVPYASAVGSIMYAVRCTRPDVAFTQNITSRFQQNLGKLHWTAVKNILKYLRNTKDMFLVYGGNPKAELRVDCYCDAGFETDRDDTKS
ncbi:retrotransposon protein, putative, ty1-copia subclass [Tanacetum coccineum]